VGSVIGLVLPSIKSLARDVCFIWICYSVRTHRYQYCCAFCGKLFFMSLKCSVFRTSSCEWTCSNGIYTTSYSIALKFQSMIVVLRVFANAMLWYSPQNLFLFGDSAVKCFITNLASIGKVGLEKVGLVLPWWPPPLIANPGWRECSLGCVYCGYIA